MKHVVVLHETLHKLYRKKMSGAIFKIDFEKVYDKVNWTFLHETLQMKGFFSQRWCTWIQSFVKGGNVGTKVNE
jgi:hypothetical protein